MEGWSGSRIVVAGVGFMAWHLRPSPSLSLSLRLRLRPHPFLPSFIPFSLPLS
jgi:hypothetical protein